ncbi:cell wall hydrolase [Sphingorhabdus arenilitoris]|uniref:Cell wall hydrolase n=1 Tax=Sphingorhabdus arenilitoris TaxID=1490041 RepID=A0ABV8RC02_9SPHN
MIQEPFPKNDDANRRRPAPAPRRRLIGGREILLVLIAFSLLALAPSIAQVTGFSSRSAPSSPAVTLGSAERPESNFAGSAFYFMEQDYAIPPSNEVMDAAMGDKGSLIGVDPLSSDVMPADETGLGGSAQPFVMNAASADYARALKCLTDAIYYEAASESDSGQRAVAQVIINRMRHPTYPNNICGVVYQGSERRTGCQFSYSCDGSMARIPSRSHWLRAGRVAASALAGYVHRPVGMATHYHTVNIYPYWAPSLHFIGTIGMHRFYRWKGSAGRPSAFFRSYAGNEPFPGPKPRAWKDTPAPSLDPIQLQKQYEREYAAARLKAEEEARGRAAASAQSGIAPAPAYSEIVPQRQRSAPVYSAPDYSREALNKGGDKAYGGGKLPGTTNIKPEYQNSGTWKAQPTG